MWQSLVFALAAVWFALTLLPSVRSPETRIPLSTSSMNIALSLLIGFTHLSLGFVTAFIVNLVICAEWIFIACKRQS